MHLRETRENDEGREPSRRPARSLGQYPWTSGGVPVRTLPFLMELQSRAAVLTVPNSGR